MASLASETGLVGVKGATPAVGTAVVGSVGPVAVEASGIAVVGAVVGSVGPVAVEACGIAVAGSAGVVALEASGIAIAGSAGLLVEASAIAAGGCVVLGVPALRGAGPAAADAGAMGGAASPSAGS